MKELLIILVSSAIVNNVVLSQFLGLCPFLGVSKSVETAAGMGGAIIFVITLSSFVNFYLNFSKRDVVFDIPFTLNMICYILFSKSSADNFNRCAKASCHS